MLQFNPTTNVYENDESHIETKTFGKENSRYLCKGTGKELRFQWIKGEVSNVDS